MNIFIPNNAGYSKYDISFINEKTIENIGCHLGYHTCQMYVPSDCLDFDINVIVFKIFTNEVVFAYIDREIDTYEATIIINRYIDNKDIIKDFNSSLEIENTLSDGIREKCLTSEFMGSVLNIDIPQSAYNIKSKLSDFSFDFKDGIMVRFSHNSGFQKEIISWMSIFPSSFNIHLSRATAYFNNDNNKINRYLMEQAMAIESISIEELEILHNHSIGVNYALYKIITSKDTSLNVSIDYLINICLGITTGVVFFE